ncbi:trypsin-like serine protease [Lentzea sp. NPDC004782]|uniref:trypsin-like serine protease n=1 Tax=Lentzea sp. NPDC004782 TaxID=3154458 RepID=UPI0033BBDC71
MTAAVLTAGLVTSGAVQALSGGTEVPQNTYPWLARVSSPTAACTGSLVAPQWVLTAKRCAPQQVSVAGRTVGVAKIVDRDDRDVALVELQVPVVTVAPVVLGAAPLQGEALRVAGFGRTATEWVPDRPRTALFTVTATTATTALVTGNDGADTCKGDAGGPAFREVNGTAQLVGLSSTSWQHGCLAVAETRQGSTEARVDDLGAWVQATTRAGETFVGVRSGQCIDQDYTDGQPHQRMLVFPCSSGANQKWDVEWTSANTVRLHNLLSGACLDQDYTDGQPHSSALAFLCHNEGNQQWQVVPNDAEGSVQLINVLSGQCLDQEYPVGEPTMVLAVWGCNGGANQRWKFA